jgi:glycosyltransferase involved in cell wall biosynthesis
MTPYCIGTETLLERTADATASPDLVSVAVSLFNYARFLPEALESVAAQTHRALELIIVDDASDADDSAAAACGWAAAHAGRFARVLVLQHRRNQGLAAARNTAFAAARGEHVFVLDADNTIFPRAIARLREAIVQTGFAAAYSQLVLFGEARGIGAADVWHRDYFHGENYVDAMALIAHSAWQEVGGYNQIEGGWEDYGFWCKFIEAGLEAAFVPELLCRYRVHQQSMLRTEHKGRREHQAIQLSLRHPWLRVE